MVDSLLEAEYPLFDYFIQATHRYHNMEQISLFQTLSWSVTDLTRYVRELLEGDDLLQDLWVEGEVSNFSRPASGHIYFTLKDASASLRCVMWRSNVLQQKFLPRDGNAVRVHGNINIYEAGGQYQLYADIIRLAGEGALYQEFLRLKARLEEEGLFDQANKRPVPSAPGKIGIVTSPTGAALRDILNTLSRRYPLAEVILASTSVQGSEAPMGIVAALTALNQVVAPDVILLARGGGSIEDLWAFNDEQVARAIVASPAPVITGVGHETDFTIADFASDLRAPTPTAAAELATPNRQDLLAGLQDTRQSMFLSMQESLASYRQGLNMLEGRLRQRSPRWIVMSDRQRLDEFLRREDLAYAHYLALQKSQFNGLEQRLSALSPLAVLGRGYAIVSRRNGRLVRSVRQVSPGDPLTVRVSDGEFDVLVKPDIPD
jgi:exodeoxyribonuclease VII large subunit